MTENVAIILAAGCGVRFGGSVPKQYLSFGKTMLLDQTIGVFISSDIFSKILIIVNPHHQKFYKQSIYYDKVFFIDGGNTRSQSVFNAIFFLNDCGIDINTILIHDGVRPYITNTLIKNVFDELIKYGVGHGVIPIT
ncbi:MAG: 2-C-methyl-D-erythritol 4-phosphate cytidylyltransferase, partial [Candidatus Heimdallarchaeota archaeon]|nr:2-C-methyl-D-erythritol 4-phosphate cytidylyltransferase [Candidatus Heimdallarchaeota archaeon]